MPKSVLDGTDRDLTDKALDELGDLDDEGVSKIYEAYGSVHDSFVSIARQFGIAAALVPLATFGVITNTNEVGGLKVEPAYFAVAALGYTTVCFVLLAALFCKVRVFARYFERMAERPDMRSRIAARLRYPRALIGPSYLVPALYAAKATISWRQFAILTLLFLVSGSVIASAMLGWIATLIELWMKAPDVASRVTRIGIALHLLVVLVMSLVSRGWSRRQRYELKGLV